MKQFTTLDRGIILTDNTGLELIPYSFMKLFSETIESTSVKWFEKPLWSLKNHCPFNYVPVSKSVCHAGNLYLFSVPSAVRRDFDLEDLDFPFNPIGIIVFVELNDKHRWKDNKIHITKKTGLYWVAKSSLPCVVGLLEAHPHVVTREQMIDIIKIPNHVPIVSDDGAMDKISYEPNDAILKFINACINAVIQLQL